MLVLDLVLVVFVFPGVSRFCLGGFGSEDWRCCFRFRVVVCVPGLVLVVGLMHSRRDLDCLVLVECVVVFLVFWWVLGPLFVVCGVSCLFGGLM